MASGEMEGGREGVARADKISSYYCSSLVSRTVESLGMKVLLQSNSTPIYKLNSHFTCQTRARTGIHCMGAMIHSVSMLTETKRGCCSTRDENIVYFWHN